MTDEELAAFEDLLGKASVRTRLAWQITQSLTQYSDEYKAFKTFLGEIIPEPRLSILMP